MLSWFRKKKKNKKDIEETEEIISLDEKLEENEENKEDVDREIEEIEEKEENKKLEELEEIEETAKVETKENIEQEELKTELDEKTDDELEEPKKKKKGFFKKIFSNLDKTRKNIGDKIDRLVNNYGEIDDELFEELEEILIMADIGMDSTLELIESLRERLKENKVKDSKLVKGYLKEIMIEEIKTTDDEEINLDEKSVILVIGVNGAGKTTSIGKLARLYKDSGKEVLLAAADTFRAAAIEQLEEWAKRSDIPLVKHQEGSDPSAVIFDAMDSFKAKNKDVLICDTAGRLHNKKNLMNELAKMNRIIEKQLPDTKKEVLLVLDATTGQNAINQAKLFMETATITGLVLSKLDGTAKGGFVFGIKKELGIPVKFVGIGEGISDMQSFDSESFVEAIVGE